MEVRQKLLSIPEQLEESQKAKAERNELIIKLKEKNEVAQKEITARNKTIDMLMDAQDVEHRIIALLNHLNVRQDEDRYKLLLQEQETKALVLRTVEDLCKSIS